MTYFINQNLATIVTHSLQQLLGLVEEAWRLVSFAVRILTKTAVYRCENKAQQAQYDQSDPDTLPSTLHRTRI